MKLQEDGAMAGLLARAAESLVVPDSRGLTPQLEASWGLSPSYKLDLGFDSRQEFHQG